MRKITLRTALKKLGYEIVQFTNQFNVRTGFMRKGGQLYYFSYGDIRWSPTLLVRTADEKIKDKKGKYADFKGGINTYPEKDLKQLGFYIEEKRKSWDGA